MVVCVCFRTSPVVRDMKELLVEADIENIRKVIDFVNAELEHHVCPPDRQTNINLAVEEVFTNIVNHSGQPPNEPVSIFIAVNGEAVIRFEDTGKFYNPLEHPEPDIDKPLMEREVGGLGIFLVKKMMDKTEYSRIGNKNVLTLMKKIR